MTQRPTSGQHYIIRIREKIDERWAEWFNGMSITLDDEGTELNGRLADQAALHGIIATISRLGLQLVAIHQAPPSDPPRAAEPSGMERAEEYGAHD